MFIIIIFLLLRFILKNEYTQINEFQHSIELQLFIQEQSNYLRKPSSQFESCSIINCIVESHKMRQQYYRCICTKECELKFKVKSCMVSNRIQLFRSYAEKCISSSLYDKSSLDDKIRGIPEYCKTIIIQMIDYDNDITPKRVHTQLTLKGKKDENNSKHLPSLTQVMLYICICI